MTVKCYFNHYVRSLVLFLITRRDIPIMVFGEMVRRIKSKGKVSRSRILQGYQPQKNVPLAAACQRQCGLSRTAESKISDTLKRASLVTIVTMASLALRNNRSAA